MRGRGAWRRWLLPFAFGWAAGLVLALTRVADHGADAAGALMVIGLWHGTLVGIVGTVVVLLLEILRRRRTERRSWRSAVESPSDVRAQVTTTTHDEWPFVPPRGPALGSTMQCRACGYGLDGVRGDVCPECAQPFDPLDHDTFVRRLVAPARLCMTASAAEAHGLRAVLEQAGVHAAVESVGNFGLEVLRGWVWVNEADLDSARTILDRLRAGPDDARPWTCARCGETVDAGFDLCWSCSTPRDG